MNTYWRSQTHSCPFTFSNKCRHYITSWKCMKEWQYFWSCNKWSYNIMNWYRSQSLSFPNVIHIISTNHVKQPHQQQQPLYPNLLYWLNWYHPRLHVLHVETYKCHLLRGFNVIQSWHLYLCYWRHLFFVTTIAVYVIIVHIWICLLKLNSTVLYSIHPRKKDPRLWLTIVSMYLPFRSLAILYHHPNLQLHCFAYGLV